MDSKFKDIIETQKKLYLGEDKAMAKRMKKSYHKRYVIWQYLYYFRLAQYYKYKRTEEKNSIKRRLYKNRFNKYDRLRNVYSEKSGVEIGINSSIGKNCDIWHSGVVINGNIGDNCVFHGNNTVGNKGKGKESQVPNIGNNVDIGVGAVIIGDVFIADGCVVGAGSVVTKSFEKNDSIIGGVPARVYER